jgi:hypothetical protein
VTLRHLILNRRQLSPLHFTILGNLELRN